MLTPKQIKTMRFAHMLLASNDPTEANRMILAEVAPEPDRLQFLMMTLEAMAGAVRVFREAHPEEGTVFQEYLKESSTVLAFTEEFGDDPSTWPDLTGGL